MQNVIFIKIYPAGALSHAGFSLLKLTRVISFVSVCARCHDETNYAHSNRRKSKMLFCLVFVVMINVC
jgi:cytochrome c553